MLIQAGQRWQDQDGTVWAVAGIDTGCVTLTDASGRWRTTRPDAVTHWRPVAELDGQLTLFGGDAA